VQNVGIKFLLRNLGQDSDLARSKFYPDLDLDPDSNPDLNLEPRIRNVYFESRSKSGQKFRILTEPDPQHWV
jgi:hypothetical protein